jgi:hypothetical protein
MLLDLILVHLLIGGFLGLWAMWDLGGMDGESGDRVFDLCVAVGIFLLTTVIWPAIGFVMIRKEVRRWSGWVAPEPTPEPTDED